MVEGFDDLPRLHPDKLAKFVQRFFTVLADDRQFERKLIKRCRG